MSNLTKSQKKLEQKQKDLTKERDDKCNPLAKELLVIMAESDISGELTGSDHADYLKIMTPVYKKFIVRCQEENLTVGDIYYTISITKSFMELTNQIFDSSLKNNVDMVERIVYGGKMAEELTVNDIDKIMKDFALKSEEEKDKK